MIDQQIVAALRFIPAYDRETWISTGMAIKAELGNNGFGLWDEWSRSADNYNEKDARAVWQSFKDGGIRIGTLFHIARQHGYTNGQRAPRRKWVQPPPKEQPRTDRYAAEIWLRADFNTVASHPYAIAKGIDWDAGAGRATVTGKVVGKNADCIVVPIRDLTTSKVRAVQCINVQGAKQTFGPVSGHGLVLGNTLDKSLYWCVVEGWASGVSMAFHHLNGNGVAGISFGKSNIDTLAQTMADIFQPQAIRRFRECDARKMS